VIIRLMRFRANLFYVCMYSYDFFRMSFRYGLTDMILAIIVGHSIHLIAKLFWFDREPYGFYDRMLLVDESLICSHT